MLKCQSNLNQNLHPSCASKLCPSCSSGLAQPGAAGEKAEWPCSFTSLPFLLLGHLGEGKGSTREERSLDCIGDSPLGNSCPCPPLWQVLIGSVNEQKPHTKLQRPPNSAFPDVSNMLSSPCSWHLATTPTQLSSLAASLAASFCWGPLTLADKTLSKWLEPGHLAQGNSGTPALPEGSRACAPCCPLLP